MVNTIRLHWHYRQSTRIVSNLSKTDDGGAKEDRTPDLLRARQALSQLSYGPGIRMQSCISSSDPQESRKTGGSRWI